ncbi:hypothetical protein TSUD_162170 [Trifolium subterraneum]|uniref:Uncharacterized protein n=1 Tax=Trifolium subterraneum TaxID=3900 RepID=A0A2Z6NEI7_TRISU|nr:hypothetical protein TSUD_162170 [Trifolium subterraneum]
MVGAVAVAVSLVKSLHIFPRVALFPSLHVCLLPALCASTQRPSPLLGTYRFSELRRSASNG